MALRRRDLEDLERQARVNPSPLNFSRLAERCIAFGEMEGALEVIKTAMERFPDSDRVRATYQQIMKTRLQDRIHELQRELETNPTPRAYARLATLYYRDMGDRNKALELCRRGITRFPDNADLHLIDGSVRLDRYHDEWLANDGTKASEHLRRCHSLDPSNYKALLLLGKLYAEVGALGHALEVLENILQFTPEDQVARDGLEKIKSRTGAQAPDPGQEDLEALFKQVEKQGGLSAELQQLAEFYQHGSSESELLARSVPPEKVSTLISTFEGTPDLKAAVVIDAKAVPVASLVKDGVEKEQLARLIHQIHQVSQDSSRRMDIGGFIRGTINGPFGKLLLIEVRDYVLGVLGSERARDEQLWRRIESFLDEVARAS